MSSTVKKRAATQTGVELSNELRQALDSLNEPLDLPAPDLCIKPGALLLGESLKTIIHTGRKSASSLKEEAPGFL